MRPAATCSPRRPRTSPARPRCSNRSPRRGRVRVTALPVPSDDGHRRQPLARTRSRAATASGSSPTSPVCSPAAASTSRTRRSPTWPDGGARSSRSRCRRERDDLPETWMLEEAIAGAIEHDLTSEPNPTRGWRSTTTPRPGTRSARSGARTCPACSTPSPSRFADAGVDVHSARVSTVGGEAIDTFEVTDRNGRKLDGDRQAAVARAVNDGVRGAGGPVRAPPARLAPRQQPVRSASQFVHATAQTDNTPLLRSSYLRSGAGTA